jgi:hypothetical protein
MTRDRRLMVLFTALSLLAFGGVWVGTVYHDGPAAAVTRTVATGPDGVATVTLLGDTYLGGKLQQLGDQRGAGYAWAFDGVRPVMAADFTILDAEGPISDLTQPWNPLKIFSHSSRPAAAAALADAGVDAVTLGNDHVYDVGPGGVTDTMDRLDDAGIAAVGAGPNRTRAQQPLLLHTAFGTLGVVSLGGGSGSRATDDQPGVAVLDPAAVQRGIDLARAAGADWVVAVVQWGDDYAAVNSLQRSSAQEFARAGYDLVVGVGPHSTQPIELVGGMPVIYSVGNFVFGTDGRFAQFGAPGYGLSTELELGPTRAPRVAVRCLATDNRALDFRARPCTDTEARTFLPTLNPTLGVSGNLGVLPCAGCFARRPGSEAHP